MRAYGLDLPEYPWETLIPYRKLAAEHPGGTIDLSIGTPVDDTPQLIQDALTAASDAPGYPTTHGTVAFRRIFALKTVESGGVPRRVYCG